MLSFMPIHSKHCFTMQLLGVPREKQSEFVRNMARYIKQSDRLGRDEPHYGKREALLIKLASATSFTIDKKDVLVDALGAESEKQLQKGVYALRPVMPAARRAVLVSVLAFPVPGVFLLPLEFLLETMSFAIERFNSHFAKKAARLLNAAYLVENICARYGQAPGGQKVT